MRNYRRIYLISRKKYLVFAAHNASLMFFSAPSTLPLSLSLLFFPHFIVFNFVSFVHRFAADFAVNFIAIEAT